MTPGKTESIGSGVQAHEQDISPEPTLDLSGDTIGYRVSFSVVNQTTVGSELNATDDFVYYKVQDDIPRILLEADNVFKILQDEFESSPVNRYSGEGFEIVVEPIARGEKPPIRYRRGAGRQEFVVLDNEEPELLDVISEFLEVANETL